MFSIIIRFSYHARKPRVYSETNKSYADYTSRLKAARRQVHLQAKQYQDKIQDQYLAKHQELIRKKHFDNQCSFRAQVFTNAYRMKQNQIRWKQIDGNYTARLNKHLHDEDVKKINRSRILKIMQHESTNYWFNQENVDTRLQEQTIFPEYIASSEYYYKLFAEALAYQFGDFQQVHLFTSNQEIIRQKNKLLIPLFINLRSKIATYKKNPQKVETERYSFEVSRLKQNKKLTQKQKQDLINKQKIKYESRIKQIQQNEATPELKLSNLKKKVRDLVDIFAAWKEYTNIIGLTSAQLIKNQNDIKNQKSIDKVERQVIKKLKERQTQTFVGSVEEDTEQMQISFEQYLKKIKNNNIQNQTQQSGNKSLEELENLFNGIDIQSQNQVEGSINLERDNNLGIGQLLKNELRFDQSKSSESLTVIVNPQYLNQRQTTSSVQILKEFFKDDKQFIGLLNKLGQIDVRYPKLFQTVWQSIQ